MDKELKCLRCGNPLTLVEKDRIQLGDKAIPFSNFASGSLKVVIYYWKGLLYYLYKKFSVIVLLSISIKSSSFMRFNSRKSEGLCTPK